MHRVRYASCKSYKSTGRQRRLLMLLLALILLLVVLIIALAIVGYLYARSPPVTCTSEDCVRSAANLILSMDSSVDPCTDFYRFSCGRWGEHHPMPDSAINHDWFADRGEMMIRRIRSYLRQNNSDDDPVAVTQARTMFRACMDIDRLETLELRPMMDVLDYIGTPLPNPIPFTSVPSFKPVETMVKAKLVMDKDLLIGFGVYPDAKNRSINKLTIGKPDTDSPLPSYHELDKRIERHRRKLYLSHGGATGSGDSPLVTAYVRYVARVMSYVYTTDNSRPSVRDLDTLLLAQARKVHDMESQIYKLMHPPEPDELEPHYMTLSELQDETDKVSNGPMKLDWRQYLTEFFKDVQNVTLDLDGKDGIVVLHKRYILGVASFLSNATRVHLYNYFWWQVVESLSPHVNRHMRDLKQQYLEEVTDGNMPISRSLFCAAGVNQLMGMAVSYFIADPEFLKSTKKKVEEMLMDVQIAFHHLVDQLDWMDEATKEATGEKVAATRSFIGFPEWLLKPGALDAYYAGLEVYELTYLSNMLAIKHLIVLTMLNSLREINGPPGWATDPTDVNAFHTFQANAVTIPLGILQYPFYRLGLEALNYGAIGSILGHELTHGFDDQGRQFDKNGNLRQWWSNETVEAYINMTKCFVKQYSGYRLESIGATVDGKLTLGENIADNGGVREAFRAYLHYRDRNGQEPKLPGLEKYTDEQLFFLSFANLWCETSTRQSLRFDLTDGHSPNHVRVWGSLANSPEFARVWRCDEGTFMNPDEDKCIIW
ncbi:endothelin-converting enzyme homolog isoform X2 [Anabrus simplex]|uniref:endothelin-converting enzyme homolog isoform X2 n=1 Tax=Anabrus simplex TaxID=316456 RepID=UPI0034DD2F09